MSWMDKFFEGGYSQVQVAGTDLPTQTVLNFATGATAVDDPVSGRTVVNVTGTGGGTTINTAAGIGTIAAPGVLRGLVGGVGGCPLGLHVGGFWSLQDSGGGSFYWDGASTATDDGGTIIRPNAAGVGPSDPGRWKRIWSGAVQVDWFGAKGDSSRTGATDGTDDQVAIQSAIDFCGPAGRTLKFDANKCYRSSSYLTLEGDPAVSTSYTGMVLDGGGSMSFRNGSWIKFTGAQDDALFRIFSTLGTRVTGIEFFAAPVTRAAADHTYADQATRLAAGLTTLGATADQTDTGQRWRLKALPSSDANNWNKASFSIIDTRRKNINGIGGPAGNDGGALIIDHCSFTGPASFAVISGVRVNGIACSAIRSCAFGSLQYGISGNDLLWGCTGSECINVELCSFVSIRTRGIYNPFANWTIRGCSFEGLDTTAFLDGVQSDTVLGGNAQNVVCIGNIHDDAAGGGTAYSFSGSLGITLYGNQAYTSAGTFCYLASCIGVESAGNFIYGCTKSYDIEATGSPCSGMRLGPDYTSAELYPTGTNFRNTIYTHSNPAINKGGMSIGGGGNTFSSTNGLAVGTSNTVGASALSVGGSCTSASSGLTSGSNGTGLNTCERVLAGGTVLGVLAGAQLNENVLSKACPISSVTTLLNASQVAPSIILSDGHFYELEATVCCSKNSSNLRFTQKIWAHVKRVSGTTTIIEQGIDTTRDPGALGITCAFALNGANIDLQVTTPALSNAVNAVATYRINQGYSL